MSAIMRFSATHEAGARAGGRRRSTAVRDEQGATQDLPEAEEEADQASPSSMPLSPRNRRNLKREETQRLPCRRCLRLCVCNPSEKGI